MTTSKEIAERVESAIGLIPGFPQEGVLFRDITPLIANGPVFAELTHYLAEKYRGKIDYVAGLESRGFILAAPIAAELGIGMITLRKAGKLPPPVVGIDYALEYGTARLEVRPETVPTGARVLIVDDVLATGGTAAASIALMEQSGANVVGIFFLLELVDLNGRTQIEDEEIDVLIKVHETDEVGA
ncbi:adenine phosphoribosyltransferase [Actinomyces minihominis]|uniref:adenine phosphoribosyltransferase n=1 Tax=Actinomyces minihominis TaxID=2002838 RepID=UPI000C08144B|nr:adenine phosphoribosyltransferase [Actinomyces minihominis]